MLILNVGSLVKAQGISTWTNKGHDNEVHKASEIKPEDFLWQVC